MLTRRQLDCFVAVAEELHFSRAADRLGLAQSAVSVHIRQLESDLGVRLFNRNKRQPLSVTEAGEMFYVEAVAALLHLARAEHVGTLVARGLRGSVKVGYVASAVTSGLLARVLGAFRPQHLEVRPQLVLMETPRQLAAIEAGELDVGFLRPRPRYPRGIDATVVHSEPLSIAMHESHPLARLACLKCADLRGQTFIAPQFKDSEGFSDVLARLAQAAGIPVSADIHVNDFVTAVSLAGAGYGIVVTPQSMQNIRQAGVVYRGIDDFAGQVQLAVAYRSHEGSPAARRFVAAAKASGGPSD